VRQRDDATLEPNSARSGLWLHVQAVVAGALPEELFYLISRECGQGSHPLPHLRTGIRFPTERRRLHRVIEVNDKAQKDYRYYQNTSNDLELRWNRLTAIATFKRRAETESRCVRRNVDGSRTRALDEQSM
jgi:hypothetical protein